MASNSTKDLASGYAVASIISTMLVPRTEPLPKLYVYGTGDDGGTSVDVTRPNDRRYAIAISAGLFDVCLGLMVRFRGHCEGNVPNDYTIVLVS